MRRPLIIALVLLSLGAAGCGRDGDRENATAVAERFLAAIGSGDGVVACGLLAAHRKAPEAEEPKVREAIGGVDVHAGSPIAVELYLVEHEADLDNGEDARSCPRRLTVTGSRPRAVSQATGRRRTSRWTAYSRPEMRVLLVLYVIMI